MTLREMIDPLRNNGLADMIAKAAKPFVEIPRSDYGPHM